MYWFILSFHSPKHSLLKISIFHASAFFDFEKKIGTGNNLQYVGTKED